MKGLRVIIRTFVRVICTVVTNLKSVGHHIFFEVIWTLVANMLSAIIVRIIWSLVANISFYAIFARIICVHFCNKFALPECNCVVQVMHQRTVFHLFWTEGRKLHYRAALDQKCFEYICLESICSVQYTICSTMLSKM